VVKLVEGIFSHQVLYTPRHSSIPEKCVVKLVEGIFSRQVLCTPRRSSNPEKCVVKLVEGISLRTADALTQNRAILEEKSSNSADTQPHARH